jgi:hypothetical protein
MIPFGVLRQPISAKGNSNMEIYIRSESNSTTGNKAEILNHNEQHYSQDARI